MTKIKPHLTEMSKHSNFLRNGLRETTPPINYYVTYCPDKNRNDQNIQKYELLYIWSTGSNLYLTLIYLL